MLQSLSFASFLLSHEAFHLTLVLPLVLPWYPGFPKGVRGMGGGQNRRKLARKSQNLHFGAVSPSRGGEVGFFWLLVSVRVYTKVFQSNWSIFLKKVPHFWSNSVGGQPILRGQPIFCPMGGGIPHSGKPWYLMKKPVTINYHICTHYKHFLLINTTLLGRDHVHP